MSIGWSIIGIGVLADRSVAPSIARQSDSELVAVCSRDQGRADDFAVRHGADAAFTDYAAMLAAEDVDVVYIATPNGLHREHVLAALDAGKHVLVEKPMALTLADARELVAAAELADRRLAVGFHMRHKLVNREARRVVADGQLGALAYMEICVGAGKDMFPYGTWRSDPQLAGGGSLLNQGTHAIDLMRFVSGQSVVEVTCALDQDGIEDVVVATCRLDGGALVSLSSNQVRSGTRRDWTAVGPDGWLLGQKAMGGAIGDSLVLTRDDGETIVATSDASAHDAMIASFADAVLGRAEVNGSAHDGLANIAVVDALYTAARDRRTVTVEEILSAG